MNQHNIEDTEPTGVFTSHHKGIRVLLLASTISVFVFGLFSPFYAIYVQQLGGSLELAGTSWAVFSIVSGVLILAFSSLESSFKDKKILYIAGLLVRGIAFVLYMFISSYFELILAQILLGISVALSNPSFDALFTNHTNKHDSLTDWGGWEGFTAISAGVASLLGGYFISHFGFEYVFGAMSLLSFVVAIYLLMLPKKVL